MISFHFLGNMKFILCFFMSIFLISTLGESTLCPPKVVVIEIEIMHLIFLVRLDIPSWIIFVHLKYIALTLDLN